jgi:dethiobiotin synthetase
MSGLFVTGTDTGVGKTFVAVALCRRATALGHQPFGFKPIETGCTGPLGADQQALCSASGGWQTGELCGVYQLGLAAAPLVAATAERTTLDLDRICAVAARGGTLATRTIVEGAGGWRVPITDTFDMGGLARVLSLPVVVVARATLGTINHSLLTLEAIAADGCPLAALVLSRRPEDDLASAHSNADQIRRRWPGQVLIFDTDPTVLDPLLQS